jgi:hypothetical protein
MVDVTEAFDAAVAEVDRDIDSLPFCGEQIPVKPLPSILLLKFAKMATRDIGTDDMQGMAVMLDLIHGVVLPSARARFDELAETNDVSGSQMMDFVVAVMKANTGRPFRQPSSSEGSASTGSPKSKSGSGQVVDLGDGRIVEMWAGETTASATARALLMNVPGEDDDELAPIQTATEVAFEIEG